MEKLQLVGNLEGEIACDKYIYVVSEMVVFDNGNSRSKNAYEDKEEAFKRIQILLDNAGKDIKWSYDAGWGMDGDLQIVGHGMFYRRGDNDADELQKGVCTISYEKIFLKRRGAL